MSVKKLEDYRIGDFSKRMGVSPHFLKYYEERGILKPNVHPNGYRFYNLWHASMVYECVRLKKLGFSVKDCRRLMTDSTLADLEQMLGAREQALEREIADSQQLFQTIQNLRAALRLCGQREWRICTAEERWFLPHTGRQRFSEDPVLYRQLEQWVEGMPAVRSTRRLRRSRDGVWYSEWGFSAGTREARQLGLALESPAQRLPETKVFELYTCFPVQPGDNEGNQLQQYDRLLDRVRSIIRLPPGDTVLQQVLSYTRKAGQRQVCCILQVPVCEQPDGGERPVF